MLTQLQFYYRPSNQVRLLPQWNQFTESLVPQQEQIKKRFMDITTLPTTAGTQILRFIMKEADVPFLTNQDDDFYLYTTQIPGIMAGTKHLFDLARNGKAYRNLFIYQNSNPIWEYLVSVDDNDWLKYLPLGKEYPAWQDIQPLKLWWTDSDEYTLDMITGYLRYRTDPPSMVLWMLDIPALIMKAVAWYRWQRKYGVDAPDLSSFIQTEVLSFILTDMINNWYFKLQQLALDIQLGVKPEQVLTEMSIRSQSQWGSVGGRFKASMEYLGKHYEKVATGELHPRAIMSQKFYQRGTTSMIDILNQIDLKYDIPRQAPFIYLRLIRDLPYLEYMIRLYQLETRRNPGSTEYRNLMERLFSLTTKWKNTVPFTSIKNTLHRTFVKSKVDDLYELAASGRHVL